MSQDQQPYEIDLIELLSAIWDGKWLIAGTSALAVTFGASYLLLSPNKFEASLDLTPINDTSMIGYSELNQIDFFNVSPARLTQLITEVLLERDVFVTEFERSGLFDRSDFDTAAQYDFELQRAAFNITLERKALNRQVWWELSFAGDNLQAMTTILDNALLNAQEATRQRLIDNFTSQVDSARRSQLHTIEDTELRIEIAYDDYEISIRDRIAFLQEQAQIARALNIARNTLEVTNFNQGTSILANVNAETPFYMRGYEAIEKEIDLLQLRTNPEAFIPNLRRLRNSVRSIREDRTIERAVAAFHASPITDPENFTAIQYNLASLDVTYLRKTPLILALSVLLGGLSGVVTVLFRGAKRSRTRA